MTNFRFSLQRVLEWRRTQLELEELEYRRQMAAVADLDHCQAEVQESGRTAERLVRAWNPLAGGELEALGDFRLHVKRRERELAASREEHHKRMERQHTQLLEARRRLRLLERLKERRWEEWRSAGEKELQDLAGESYLARWRRRP